MFFKNYVLGLLSTQWKLVSWDSQCVALFKKNMTICRHIRTRFFQRYPLLAETKHVSTERHFKVQIAPKIYLIFILQHPMLIAPKKHQISTNERWMLLKNRLSVVMASTITRFFRREPFWICVKTFCTKKATYWNQHSWREQQTLQPLWMYMQHFPPNFSLRTRDAGHQVVSNYKMDQDQDSFHNSGIHYKSVKN